jgi:hypothetical protein
MNDELNVLILLSQEIKKMIERILAKKNMLIIKNGIVKKVDGNIYTVSIEQEEYLIKSQLVFAVGDIVNVLTDTKMQNKKFLLG